MNYRKIVTAAVFAASASLVWAAEPIRVYSTEQLGKSPARQFIDAVASATDGDTIIVESGTYTFGDDDYTDTVNGVKNLLRVKVSNLIIEGDTDTSRTSWPDHAEPVVIDANGKGRIFYFDNNRTNMTVRNLTLTGANTLSGTDNVAKSGGAAFCSDATAGRVVFINCVFRDNVDGRFCAGYDVTLRDCFVTNCSANVGTCYYALIGKAYDCDFVGNRKGACYQTYAYNCRFIGNYRSDGGVALANPYVISNCFFEANSGYMLSDSNDSSKFYDCTFTNNTSSNSSTIKNPGVVKGCKFWDNTGSGSGGVWRDAKGTTLVEDCKFWRNKTSASLNGGAVRLTWTEAKPCSMVVSNCYFEGNVGGTTRTADKPYRAAGGAICSDWENLPEGTNAWNYCTAYNCTFVTNTALRGSGVCGVRAVNCGFFDNNARSSGLGGNAWKSCLDGCEVVGGDILDCVVNRCDIHDVTDASFCVFGEYVRVTNSIVRNCETELNSLYKCAYTLDAEFVNCTFVTNVMNTYDLIASPITTTNSVKFVNCIFNSNRSKTLQSDIVAVGHGAKGLWSEFTFANTYYGKFAAGVLTEASFATKTGEGLLMQCEDPRFAKDKCPDAPWSLSSRSPLVGMGMVQDWMSEAIDIIGNPRLGKDGRVDVGCYQSRFVQSGFSIIFR